VWLYLPLQLATLIWAAWAVQQPALSWITRLGLTLSVGVSAGVFGMVAAHEFLHSPRRLERALALTFLASVGYMHFRIAHVHGHHRRAATPDDPATARAGESAYAFLFRSVSGQWREAWAHEALPPRGRRRGGFSLGNRMIQYIVIQGLIVIGLAAFAPAATPFWFAQAVVAIVLLELFNYVAHYGLERRVIPGRGREPFGPQHCWSVSRRMTNAALFNMGRHASHHRFSARPYQTLEETPSSPELPGGYAGAILLAMVPPLWRRVINPRLVAVERLGP
jgi:alkane 1-monooxygenase